MDAVKVRLIKDMGLTYICTRNMSFKKLAEKYGVSESTVGKYMNYDLALISPWIYKKVQRKKEKNVAKSKKNFLSKEK